MESKEALNELLYYATLDDSGFEPHMKEYAIQIEKDLEILEILKNKLEIKSPYVGLRQDIILKGTNNIFMFEEEKYFYKIEEWLER